MIKGNKIYSSVMTVLLLVSVLFAPYVSTSVKAETEAKKLELNKNYDVNVTETDLSTKNFTFTISEAGNTTIYVSKESDNLKHVVLTDSKGNEIYNIYMDTEKMETGLNKGTYFLKVESALFTDHTYKVKVGFKLSDYYEKEINDSTKTATTISLNRSYYGVASNFMDQYDYYKFSTKKKSTVTVSLKRKKDVTSKFEILNSKGSVIAKGYTDYKKTGYEQIKRTLSKGTYYVRISYNSKVPYDFTVNSK